ITTFCEARDREKPVVTHPTVRTADPTAADLLRVTWGAGPTRLEKDKALTRARQLQRPLRRDYFSRFEAIPPTRSAIPVASAPTTIQSSGALHPADNSTIGGAPVTHK